MPTMQCDGAFNLHILSRENVSAGGVVLAWTSTPSSNSSTNRSIFSFVVICRMNEPLVYCFSVARSVYVQKMFRLSEAVKAVTELQSETIYSLNYSHSLLNSAQNVTEQNQGDRSASLPVQIVLALVT